MINPELSKDNNLQETRMPNSSQSFERTCNLNQNEDNSLKRLLEEEEVDIYRKKGLKNDTNENKVAESATSSFRHKWSLTQPFLSSPIRTNSTIIIVMFYSIHVR